MYLTKKELLTLSVSIACGLPFAAQAQQTTDAPATFIQDSTVEVYGKLYPELTSYHSSSGTAAGSSVSTLVKTPTTSTPTSMMSMDPSNSRIGFRGQENLGNGLYSIFQLEGNVAVDTGVGGKSGELFNRGAFVGLKGSLGSLKIGGNMNSAYKSVYDHLNFLGLSSGNFVGANNIIAQGGFGTTNAERFHERPSNTILYESANVKGFKVLAGYSFGEQPGNTTAKSITSVAGVYENGPVYLALAHEAHYDFFGGSSNLFTGVGNGTYSPTTGAWTQVAGTSSYDYSTRLTADYSFASQTRVGLDVATTTLSEAGGTYGHFQSYQHNSWIISADQKLGAYTVAVAHGASAAGSCTLVGSVACNTSGLNAAMTSLGVSYPLSKRTMLFALYTYLHNGHSANFDNDGSVATNTVTAGQDLSEMAVGMMVKF